MHLPAPHVWQVVPAGQPRSMGVQVTSPDTHTHSNGHAHHTHSHDHANGHSSDLPKHTQSDPRTTSPALIITLSPHVRSSLPDTDVLALTQWASSRVLGAFAKGNFGKDRECTDVEVTVGVMRV